MNRYPDNDYFVIQTSCGNVPIKIIELKGERRIKEFELPMVYSGEYRDAKTGAPISQVLSFAPQRIMGNKFAVEFHKLAEPGETQITMSRLPIDA